MAFWVEHVEETDKQIVCLLCYEGLSRYIIYGILIEEEAASEVLEIDFRGNEKVEYTIKILQDMRKMYTRNLLEAWKKGWRKASQKKGSKL